MKKLLVAVVGIGLVATAGFLATAKPSQELKRPVESHSQKPSNSIFATGRVEGATREIELRPAVAGRAVEVVVREGDHVQKDQLLLMVEHAHLQSEVARVAAEVELSVAQLQKVSEGPTEQQLQVARAQLQASNAKALREQATWHRVDEPSAFTTSR